MTGRHAIDARGEQAGRRMRTTAVANNKGGTGKTTTAVNVAAIAASMGYLTVLVDLDDQGSATKWLGHSPANTDLVEVFRDDRPLDDVIKTTGVKGLELVRASAELADADRQFGGEAGVQHALLHALERATQRDFVVIDCPGDLGLVTIMGLAAADDVLIPLAAGAMELNELHKLTRLIDKVRLRLNGDLRISGVLPCRVSKYGKHTSKVVADVLDTLRKHFPDELLSTIIHESIRHGEAFSAQQPISWYEPGGTGDREYRAAVAELLVPRVVEVAAHG
ncbi:MAG: ParA family protein [Pseudonocardiaceae bacterium]